MKQYVYASLFAITAFIAIVIIMGNQSIHEVSIAGYAVKGQVINLTANNVTKIGISADTDKLDFGRMIFNKTNATKLITVSNPLPYEVILKLNITGNISPLLYYKREYILGPNESRNIPIKFVPEGIGNYSGMLEIKAIYFTNSLGKKIYQLKRIMKVVE